MKNLIYNAKTYLTILVLTSIFTLAFMTKLYFNSSSYYKMKCEGVVLEKGTEYVITNQFIDKKKKLKDNTLVLEFPKQYGYMPNYLGKLYFDKKENNWLLKLADSIQNKDIENQNLLPFVRKSEKNGDDYDYFVPGQEIKLADLLKGIVINRYGGTARDRIELTIFKEANFDILKFDSEAINREYKLKKHKQEVSVIFNSKTELSDYNFYFEKTSKLKQEHQLKITTDAFGCRIYDENENEIKEDTFEIGNAMFSIKPIIPFWQNITFILILFQAIWFSVFFINRLDKKENPIQKSLLLVRVLINQLAIIGLPLFIITFGFHDENCRKFLLVFLYFLFNILHNDFLIWLSAKPFVKYLQLKTNNVFGKMFFIRLNQYYLKVVFAIKNIKYNNKYDLILSILFFSTAFFLFAFCNNSERILGAPALHFQKLIIIVAYIIFSSNSWGVIRSKIDILFNKYASTKLSYFIPLKLDSKNVLILTLSGLLSIASQDFGAILYVFFAILIIEFLRNKIPLKSIFLLILIVFVASSFFVLCNFEYEKLYRIMYWISSPDNQLYENFNEADRQTMTYLYHGLKNTFFTNPFGLQQDLVIPNVCKSVSFSDYAFFWSFMLNGFFFLSLFIIICSLLTFHFIFLLFLSINKIQINTSTSIEIFASKFGAAYTFWFAITCVSFVYPVITNLALPFAMLTGQSLPFISVGIWDMLVINGLVIVLEKNFKSLKFTTNDTSNSVSIATAFNKITKQTVWLFLALLTLITIKGIQIYFQKDVVEITRNAESEQYNYNLKDKTQIISLINNDSLDEKSSENRKKIAAFQYGFYKGKPEPKLYTPNFKMSSIDFSKKTSLSSFFTFDTTEISGSKAPFGKVYSKKYFINGKEKYQVSNEYYFNSINYDSLNNDLNAEITKKLEKHIKSMNRAIEGTVIIRDNKTGKNIVVATNLNKNKNRELAIEHTPYFIGSVKKPILLIATLKIDDEYMNFKVNDSTMTQWIAHSSNNYTQTLLADVLKNNAYKFNYTLLSEFELPFYSITTSSYSDYPKDNLFDSLENPKLNDIRSIGIGGNVKYSPMQVVGWYQHISNVTFGKDNTYLQKVLNAPLQIGTAKIVASKLNENGIDAKHFIAKTGTFQKGKNSSSNLSSSFVISNKDFTILVTLNGEQQANNEHKSAKYFFNKIIPLLLQYDVLYKSKK